MTHHLVFPALTDGYNFALAMSRSILALALIATASAATCADFSTTLVDAVSAECGMGACKTISSSGTGYTGASTACTLLASDCVAATTEATADGVTITTVVTCDGNAEAASTGCMVILVFLVLYV
jgi:hypothetical protein